MGPPFWRPSSELKLNLILLLTDTLGIFLKTELMMDCLHHT